MELSEFIAEAMSQIINGVDKMHQKIKGVPGDRRVYYIGLSGEDKYDKVGEVVFDVSVALERNSTDKGGFKINIIGNELGANTTSNSKQGQQNRVKFSLPICFTQIKPR